MANPTPISVDEMKQRRSSARNSDIASVTPGVGVTTHNVPVTLWPDAPPPPGYGMAGMANAMNRNGQGGGGGGRRRMLDDQFDAWGDGRGGMSV